MAELLAVKLYSDMPTDCWERQNGIPLGWPAEVRELNEQGKYFESGQEVTPAAPWQVMSMAELNALVSSLEAEKNAWNELVGV